MKLVALVVTLFAALAPMQVFAGETCSNDANKAAVNVNVQVCDIGVDVL
jgi:hypothetical protein